MFRISKSKEYREYSTSFIYLYGSHGNMSTRLQEGNKVMMGTEVM
jgi:hypothetical protein